jgi:hypothetical protein
VGGSNKGASVNWLCRSPPDPLLERGRRLIPASFLGPWPWQLNPLGEPWKLNPEDGVALRRDLPDGRILDLLPLVLGGVRMARGSADSDGYDEVWDFETVQMALGALLLWDVGRSPEPLGWSRHFPTGRRRTHGDPRTERIEP